MSGGSAVDSVTEETVAGVWTFDSDQVVQVGTIAYIMTFTPTDSKYSPKTAKTTITGA
jgi:hypothetical protein